MLRCTIACWVVATTFSIPASVHGDVIPICPFEGALSENFDSFSQGARQQMSILDGFGRIRNLTEGGALKVEYSSSLNGVLVVPHSPPLMMGQLGISEWEFDEPVARFGGFWANNSRFDDALVDFYDDNGELIDSVAVPVPNSGAWYWNGWESDVPIKWIVVVGNDTEYLNGFIWFDDVQID
jgi:hypothetical protein